MPFEQEVVMRQLARTLLILGSVTACERAQPVVDQRERPAVGNIGQTGRVVHEQRQQQQPAVAPPAAIAQPLAGTSGAPAVGNIGQTGAPKTAAPNGRVQRMQRVQRVQRLQRVQRAAMQPLVTREERPATGNVMTKGRPRPHSELAIVDSTGAAEVMAKSPLVDRRERPMVGNLTRSGTLRPTKWNLEMLEKAIAETEAVLRQQPSNAEAKQRLHELRLDLDDVQQEMR
jgi:hypothetical protein